MQLKEINFICPHCNEMVKDEGAEDITFDSEALQMYHISCIINNQKNDTTANLVNPSKDITKNINVEIEAKGD